MTSPTASQPAPATGASKVSLWIALGALLVGAVVAVLGVRAGVDSYQRQQDISAYAHARSTAAYFVRNGDVISASMKRLQVLDREDVRLMRSSQDAMEARDVARFNELVASANNRNKAQQSLQNQMTRFQAAFERALER